MTAPTTRLAARVQVPSLTGRLRAVIGWTWYPVLFPLVFVTEPLARYNVEVLTGTRVVLVAAAIGIVVTLVSTRLLGRDHGALVALLVGLGLVGATSPERVALVVAAILLVVLERWLAARGRLRVRLPWPRVTEALNVVLAIMLVIQVVRVGEVRATAPVIPIPAAWTAGAPIAGPDVFVILADGHGRPDVLARDFGYDSSGLSTTLQALSFTPAPDSHANHVLTRFSLTVLFNGQPLTELGQSTDGPVNEDLPFKALRSSATAQLLRTAGYEFDVLASGYEHLTLRGSTRYIDVGPRNEVEQAMLDGTAIGQAVDSLTAGYFDAMHERVLRELSTVTDLARTPVDRPQFVFAHLPSPHWPMVFRADCSFRPVDTYTRGAIDRDYRAGDQTAIDAQRDQTMCIDSLLAKTVSDVVAARPDAVVIVLSDHGPEERLDWNAPAEPGLGDRFANLFWARTPGQPDLFPDDITMVNVLPILFNAYLGTDLPLHPDDLWFGPAPNNDHFVPYTPPAT